MLPNDVMFSKMTFYSSRNYLKYKNVDLQWDEVRGYSSSARMKAYPFRALQSGKGWGLIVGLFMEPSHLEYFCSASVQGFEVKLHNPWEFPQMRQHSFAVPLRSLVHVAVTPEAMMTSEELHGYSSEERQCYFPEERALRFFKQYTRSNCELECLANATFRACQCVAFYMPRDLDTPVCNQVDECLHSFTHMFQLLNAGLEEDIKDSNFSKGKKKYAKTCNCLQSCSSLKYHVERSQVSFDFDNFLALSKFSTMGKRWRKWKNRDYLSLLWIFYKESHFIPTRRMELYDTGSFIANCGGLLGLCLGMSFLSILELLYWLLVRPFRRSREVAPQPIEINTLSLPAYYKRHRRQLPRTFYTR